MTTVRFCSRARSTATGRNGPSDGPTHTRRRSRKGPHESAKQAIRTSPISPDQLAGLIQLIDDGTISGKIAKSVFEKMWSEGGDPRAIVEREGLTQVADSGALGAVIDEVIAANPKIVADFRSGKKAAAGALVGAVMKATRGKANPSLANQLLQEKLSKP